MAKSIDSLDSSGPSEVHSWLKSLSPGLKLERLSTQFENRGFRSRRSLAYVKSEDLDAFFPSPDKLCCVPNVVLRLPRNKYVGFHLFLVFEGKE